jgi:hypothetical protein
MMHEIRRKSLSARQSSTFNVTAVEKVFRFYVATNL